MEVDVQPNTLTTEQGAEKIKSLMFPETQPEAKPQPEESQADEEMEGDDDEAVELDEETEGEEEVLEDESAELYKVKIDGQEKDVTLDELIKGYQLEAHYTQKSQKLAEEQKAVGEERKILQNVSQKFEQLGEVVTYLEGVNSYLENTLPPMPNIDLAKTNPAEYIQQKEMREIALRNMGAINHRIAQTKEQAKAIVADMQAAGAVVIRQKMPELLQAQNISGLYSYLQETYGYSKEHIDSNVDPNLFMMAEKARRYDDMMTKAQKPDYIKQKVHKAKQKPKARQGMTQQNQAITRFKDNPSTENAARAIRGLL